MDENVAFYAEQTDALRTHDALTLIQLVEVDFLSFTACKACNHFHQVIAQVENATLSNVARTEQVNPIVISLLVGIWHQKLAKRYEWLDLE